MNKIEDQKNINKLSDQFKIKHNRKFPDLILMVFIDLKKIFQKNKIIMRMTNSIKKDLTQIIFLLQTNFYNNNIKIKNIDK